MKMFLFHPDAIHVVVVAGIIVFSVVAYYWVVVSLLKIRKLHLARSVGYRFIIYGWMAFLALWSAVTWVRMQLGHFWNSSSYKPLAIFTIYVFCVPLFAVFYYSLYRRNRAHFSFASNIAADQIDRMKATTGNDLEKATLAEIILRDASQAITTQGWRVFTVLRPAADADSEAMKEFKVNYTFDQQYLVVLPGNYYTECGTGVYPQSGVHTFLTVSEPARELESFRFPDSRPSTIEDFSNFHEEAMARCADKVHRLTERLSTLNSGRPDAWNYLDFLYFSTITQTTVGYGDILPNSTLVRMIVSVQILLGYFIIAILINVTFVH